MPLVSVNSFTMVLSVKFQVYGFIVETRQFCVQFYQTSKVCRCRARC